MPGGTQVVIGGVVQGQGAATDVHVLTTQSEAGLSNEVNVGATPGGELGGTWASPTVDATHSGSAHHSQDHAVCNGRLTLTTAVPVTTGDVTAAGTLYFTPFRGNRIGTYSGSAWTVQAFAEKSLDISALVANTNYDIFIVDSTLVLEAVAWTSDTARATALVLQDGVPCKTGALTRRYLGTIRITGSTGQCEDSGFQALPKRFVWNAYNRVPRAMQVIDSTDTWTLAVAAWRLANNTATNHRLAYVCGLAEDAISAYLQTRANLNNGDAASVGIGVDVTNAFSGLATDVSAGTTLSTHLVASYRGLPGLGYHELNWLEYARGGTITFTGDASIPGSNQGGLQAEVWG